MKVSACGPGDYQEAGAAGAEYCQSFLLFGGFVGECCFPVCVRIGKWLRICCRNICFSRTGKAPAITARSVEHNHKLCRGEEVGARARQKSSHSSVGTKLVSNFLYSM